MNRVDIYQQVTDRIIEALEQGTVPWRKPWDDRGGLPYSIGSGRTYRGVNITILSLSEYVDPRWGTFKAMKEAAVAHAKSQGRTIVLVNQRWWEIIDGQKVWFDGGVRKGEKATDIILWKPVPRKAEEGEESAGGSYLLLKSYKVFNAAQVEGLPELPAKEEREHTPVEEAERIVQGYVWSDGRSDTEPIAGDGHNTGPSVFYGHDRAAYSPVLDKVMMPDPEQFHSGEEFYSTLFHELVHSTGHESRLKRIEPALFGTDPYAKEELVAEMGASFLVGAAGLPDAGGEQSAAYLASWLRRLKDDRKLVVVAAAQAQKAADLILDTKFDDTPESAPADSEEERPLVGAGKEQS
jgi:antirestriction protein ArdC